VGLQETIISFFHQKQLLFFAVTLEVLWSETYCYSYLAEHIQKLKDENKAKEERISQLQGGKSQKSAALN